jgi:hypothetical protein
MAFSPTRAVRATRSRTVATGRNATGWSSAVAGRNGPAAAAMATYRRRAVKLSCRGRVRMSSSVGQPVLRRSSSASVSPVGYQIWCTA